MRASPLSTFGVLVTPYGLLGTPGNLELRKRTGVAGLTANNVDLAGFVGDIDVGLTGDTNNHDTLYIDHVRGSLRRNPRADFQRNLAVLPRPRAFGARREELSYFA